MARYDWYILRVWHSGRRSGEQWAARLEAMPEGESRRFNRPELLLDHLRTLILPAEVGQGQARDASDERQEGEPDADTTATR